LAGATEKIYKKIHGPLPNCRLLLSPRFSPTVIKTAVNIEVVNSIVDYLKNLKKPCDVNCACYKDLNCNCVCDCNPYDCNCDPIKNCYIGEIKPMTQNCGSACNCRTGACNCGGDCDCVNNVGSGGGSGACTFCTYSDGGTCCTPDGSPSMTCPNTPSVSTSNPNGANDGGGACGGGGGGGGDGCLPLWEKIETPNGKVPISDIKVGDEVYSWNLLNNRIELDKVFHKYVSNEEAQIYKIEFESGEPLYCDGLHVHYTTSWIKSIDLNLLSSLLPQLMSFVKVKQLKIGDKILTRNGGYKIVKSISKYSKERIAEIYLRKNVGYIIKECFSLIPNKDVVQIFPNEFIQYGVDGIKRKMKIKPIVLMIVYWFRLLFFKIKKYPNR